MYIDYILLSVAGICFIIMSVLAIYLAVTKRKTIIDKTLLDDSSDTVDMKILTNKLSKTDTRSDANSSEDIPKKEGTLALSDFFGQESDDDDEAGANMTDSTMILNDRPEKIADKYEIIEEISGGGMSRIFLAVNKQLGNQWIIKYVDRKIGELSGEEDILKSVNHISLPKIVDIYHGKNGTYIVESYIEGIALDAVVRAEKQLKQPIVVNWGEQLTQMLVYLHNFSPASIYHCDLKPSNIILTPDGRLVLIDFGISKREGDEKRINAVTYKYAAPEQLKKKIPVNKEEIIKLRFGELPKEVSQWKVDARTDIYSLGVMMFEFAVGDIPTTKNNHLLLENMTSEFAEIILKCLEINPGDRYQTTDELLNDIRKVKNNRINMIQKMVKRKVMRYICMGLLMTSTVTSTTGGYIYNRESGAVLEASPEILQISKQQSALFEIEKVFLNGGTQALDISALNWTTDNDEIAQVDGKRISGINEGMVNLQGTYRNKSVSVSVNVIEPLYGMVDVSLRYKSGFHVAKYAGDENQRDQIDGKVSEATLLSPGSICVGDDGAIYFTDAGKLRIIYEGEINTIEIESDYIRADKVRCYENDTLFILTDVWQDIDDSYCYAVMKLTDDGLDTLLILDAQNTRITDFQISGNGDIYFIYYNAQADESYICRYKGMDDIEYLCTLGSGSCAMAIDSEKYIYTADGEKGIIQRYNMETSELSYFAGTENEKHFIDGTAPMFYEPMSLQMYKGELYIFDFNVIRKIHIDEGENLKISATTVAGTVSPESLVETREGEAENIIFEHGKEIEIFVNKDGVYLTDSKKGLIWFVK